MRSPQCRPLLRQHCIATLHQTPLAVRVHEQFVQNERCRTTRCDRSVQVIATQVRLLVQLTVRDAMHLAKMKSWNGNATPNTQHWPCPQGSEHMFAFRLCLQQAANSAQATSKTCVRHVDCCVPLKPAHVLAFIGTRGRIGIGCVHQIAKVQVGVATRARVHV